MTRLHGIVAISVLGVFAVALAGGMAFAADAKATGPVFAVVDVEKAFDGSEKKQTLEKELAAYLKGIEDWFQLRSTNKLLTPEEFTQLTELRNKPKQEEADKKKIDEFLALSKQREQEFQTLQQKQGATDAEKARLKELQDQITKTDASMQEEEKKRQVEWTNKKIELSKQVMADVEAAVADVAKEKGLTMVFNKAIGEPGLVVYANIEITDEVLKKVNKK
jgi:Skp family chaperone for outer membrane proteins